jgi:hypothetical protein
MKKKIQGSDSPEAKGKFMVWFFAGGETRDDKFNVFTGSFIDLMKQILLEDFDFIRGIYFRSPMVNVIWALNNSHRPINNPANERITAKAFNQIVDSGLSPDTQLVITSSSSGSIVAAQTACYLAKKNKNNVYFEKPFHLVLGSSMISRKSELFRQLEHFQKEGTIGSIVHEELQDEGDNSAGIAGVGKIEAYWNALGILFPLLSKKFKGPSFLNTHPQKGHLHRKRSMTIQKALDYIDVILIRNRLAGDHYRERAADVIKKYRKSS